jgi:hypothetical protein
VEGLCRTTTHRHWDRAISRPKRRGSPWLSKC